MANKDFEFMQNPKNFCLKLKSFQIFLPSVFIESIQGNSRRVAKARPDPRGTPRLRFRGMRKLFWRGRLQVLGLGVLVRLRHPLEPVRAGRTEAPI